MKFTLLTLILLFISQCVYAQVFTIDDKGIVKCPTAKVGDKGTIFGETYEAVDRNLLLLRRDQGVDLSKVCTSLVTNMASMFQEKNFNQPIGNWDVSNVTDMSSMFVNSKFNQPIHNWNVSKVRDMSAMFAGSPFDQPIGSWDVSAVENMAGMFWNTPFNQPIGNWNVSKVTSMFIMFQTARNFNQPIGNWDVSSVNDMGWMFAYAGEFDQDISQWNVEKVRNMDRMFAYARKFNSRIGNWNVGRVEFMNLTFFEADAFNQDIGNWDVSKVKGMSGMFGLADIFNRDISRWDVSEVKTMQEMFVDTKFNQPIGTWNVSHVEDMRDMFKNSTFNQPINQWCVSKITSEPVNFSSGSPLSSLNKPVWGTCPGKPGLIVLSSPQNNANNFSPKPTFIWSSVSNASLYQLQVARGSDPVVLDTLVMGTQHTVQKILETGKVYSWRVRGINESRKLPGEWSSIWNFTTLTIPTPQLVAPANGSTGLSGNIGLNWTPTGNTTDYQLQISNSSGFLTYILNSNVSAPPFSLAAFQPGDPASFFWRVRSNSEFGPGAWSPTWTFTRAKLTSTGDEAEVPAEYSLAQNFPNPFNPTTQISFTLPRSASVRLEVFNSLGQRVSTLTKGQLPAGAHTYAFDGAALSSGIYLYRLTTPDFVQTRVMALVK